MSLIFHEGRIITSIKDTKAMKDVSIPRKKRNNDRVHLCMTLHLFIPKEIQSSCTKNSSLENLVGLLISTFLFHNNRVDVHWLP
jgi:hypothetical protein